MAESTLTASRTEIRRWLARFLGWRRNTGALSDQHEQDAEDFTNGGLRLFYNPPPTVPGRPAHVWRFLRPITTFSSVAAYNTGTITVVDGVVTLAGGTFPSWAASGELVISAGTYPVSTRDSGTQLTLVDTTLDVAALTTYALARSYYDLPDDFGGFDGRLTYQPGSTNLAPSLRRTDESHLRAMRQSWDVTGVPCWYALRPKTLTAATGQRWQITLHPLADSIYTWQYRYRVLPDVLTTTNIYHYGGQPHSQTIIAAVLAVADDEMNDGAMGKMGKFLTLLQASIDHDCLSTSPETLGYNGNAWEQEALDDNAVYYGPHQVTR